MSQSASGGARSKEQGGEIGQGFKGQTKGQGWLRTKNDNANNYKYQLTNRQKQEIEEYGFYNDHNQTIIARTTTQELKPIQQLPTPPSNTGPQQVPHTNGTEAQGSAGSANNPGHSMQTDKASLPPTTPDNIKEPTQTQDKHDSDNQNTAMDTTSKDTV
jgi:hypothetical protein